jgi:hypothetical protein
VIIASSLAFLDDYVKGLTAAPVLTQTRPGVAALRYDPELGSSGLATDPKSEPQPWRERIRQRLGGRAPSQGAAGATPAPF